MARAISRAGFDAQHFRPRLQIRIEIPGDGRFAGDPRTAESEPERSSDLHSGAREMGKAARLDRGPVSNCYRIGRTGEYLGRAKSSRGLADVQRDQANQR